MKAKRTFTLIACFLLLCCFLTGCGKTQIHDGSFTVEIKLEGGSGRVEVQSPAQLEIKGDSMEAIVLWSSPNYEYMLVNGQRYDPINREGGSAFQIPVVLDQSMEVSACTTAMSEPHLIDYSLYLDSSTLKEAAA